MEEINLLEFLIGTSYSSTWLIYCSFLILEERNQIPTLKTTCGNSGRRQNVARELTSTEGLASTKRVDNGGRSEDVGAKSKTTASARKHKASCMYLNCSA
ncbi:hypothetical protein TNCV_2552561 [Trichonephila clavipes]|nr:hypothetical protein TNCV_2552561 [Trichonephila clavipes]